MEVELKDLIFLFNLLEDFKAKNMMDSFEAMTEEEEKEVDRLKEVYLK